jgi:PAS domain S-box-containing protein
MIGFEAAAEWAQQIGKLLDRLEESGELGQGTGLGEPLAYEIEMTGQDGRRVRIEVDRDRVPPGDVQVRLNRGLSERGRAEQSVRESEWRLRELLRTAPLLAVVLDGDGNITFGNDYLMRLTGWTVAEALGKNWTANFVPAGERERMNEVLSAAGAGAPAQYEIAILGRDGAGHPVEWDSIPVRDVAGAIAATASLGRDITERRALEAKYRQAQKLESIGQLAGGVAHDFNNLLTVINGYGELLLATLGEQEPARVGVLAICAAGARAASLTRQLLSFSRRQLLQPAVLDLNAVLLEAQQMLQRMIGEEIELIARLEPALGPVRADSGQMHQLLMNLAVNARDAMPQGGRLILESANEELAGASGGVPAGTYSRVSVTDTGCGMSDEVKAHLFEPFFTTKEAGRGTGLGLSTVYGIVCQNGGHVRVESAPGAGTAFHVFLPQLRGLAAEAATAPAEQTAERGTETILLAEDDPQVRELVADFLKRYGYSVLEAAGGEEAQGVSGACQGEIPLLVTDVAMPGMSGIELAERLKIQRPGIRVLYITGYAEREADGPGGMPPGAQCLRKPFGATVLAGRVREILDEGSGRGSVLVVNGEDLLRALLGQILSGVGYEVIEARDGKEAIAWLRRRGADVVILDLAMPGPDRMETLATIRRQFAEVQVVAIAALGGDRARMAALLGVRETLEKPVAPRDLVQAVRKALGGGRG